MPIGSGKSSMARRSSRPAAPSAPNTGRTPPGGSPRKSGKNPSPNKPRLSGCIDMSAPDTTEGETLSPRVADPLHGILLKVVSVCFFVVISTMLKATQTVPAGEMVFFRSFFALLPVLAFLAWRGQLGNAFATQRPVGHI